MKIPPHLLIFSILFHFIFFQFSFIKKHAVLGQIKLPGAQGWVCKSWCDHAGHMRGRLALGQRTGRFSWEIHQRPGISGGRSRLTLPPTCDPHLLKLRKDGTGSISYNSGIAGESALPPGLPPSPWDRSPHLADTQALGKERVTTYTTPRSRA